MEGYLFTPKPYYGSVKIKRGQIETIRKSREPKKIKSLILPGFITTHIHTIQTHARNTAENKTLLAWLRDDIWPFESRLTKQKAYASSLDGMKECLSNGITTILDMASTRHTDSVFEAANDIGIRAFIGKALMDHGPKNLVERSPIEEVFHLLDTWHGRTNGRLQVTLCPRFALSCSKNLLKTVGELSSKLSLLHHTHASESEGETAWIRKKYKVTNIGLLEKLQCLNDRTILAHTIHITQADLKLIKKRKTSISHCPTSNLKLGSGLADIQNMKGINVTLGVDGAACNNRLDPFFEMRLAHLLSRHLHGMKGVSAKNIFEMATLKGAKALKSGHALGSLEPGKQADLVVVKVPDRISFNPKFPYESLLHSITSSDVEFVYVSGQKVYSA